MKHTALLAALLALSLTACGDKPAEAPVAPVAAPAVTAAPSVEAASAPAAMDTMKK